MALLAKAIKAIDGFNWEHGKRDFLYETLYYFRAKMINVIFEAGYELKRGAYTVIKSKHLRTPVLTPFPNKGISIGELIEDDLIKLAWLRLDASSEWNASDFSEILLNEVTEVGASYILIDKEEIATAQLNIAFDAPFYPKEFFFLMEKGVKF